MAKSERSIESIIDSTTILSTLIRVSAERMPRVIVYPDVKHRFLVQVENLEVVPLEKFIRLMGKGDNLRFTDVTNIVSEFNKAYNITPELKFRR